MKDQTPTGVAGLAEDQSKGRSKRRGNGLGGVISLEDFYAYMPMHSYIFVPSREMWPGASVNARVPRIPLFDAAGNSILNKNDEQVFISASHWLDENRPVEQMTWCPGFPMLLKDRLVSHGGWIERKGVHCFNLYRPPLIKLGDPRQATPWLRHVRKVYPRDAKRIIRWLAHRVQKPQEKINHGLVLGGKPGIGKDTILEPVKYAVGSWNFIEISPAHLLGRFNGFVKSTILRISEARDLGDINRYSFYEHMKVYLASPPDVIHVDEKNIREYSVFNCCGVIITTNHKSDGIFLPPDDRRHYVAWSDLDMDDFEDGYWNEIWSWYATGGIAYVAAYLTELDIRAFDAKAPPPKTEAFWDIVNANRASEDAELADVLDKMNWPAATTLARVLARAETDLTRVRTH
jgi:Family of unknown function (DUF5906)